MQLWRLQLKASQESQQICFYCEDSEVDNLQDEKTMTPPYK